MPAIILVLACLLLQNAALAQSGFQIVWVAVGEAATADDAGSVRAGRQLFSGRDLALLSLNDVRVSLVDVRPVITQINLGERLCLGDLGMRASGPDGRMIPGAPLTVTVRQDQRSYLHLRRTRKDICMTPDRAGEYPVRLTSLLPAPDGSMRGAQVFLHVADPRAPASAVESAEID